MAMMPAAPPAAPGPTGPAAVPSGNPALRMRGRVMMSMVMRALAQATQMLGVDNEDGAAAAKALAQLSAHFGKADAGLERSELSMLGSNVPAVSQPNAAQSQAMSRLAGMGMGMPPAGGG